MNNHKEITTVNIESLKPDPNQPRKEFNEEELKAQGASYLEHGMINPIEIDENGMIITGESRWRAAKLAGFKEIPVIIRKGLTPEKRFTRQVCENMARKPLTSKEQVEAFKRVYKNETSSGVVDKHNPSRDKGITRTAEVMGISQTWAQQLHYMAFEAPEPLREAFKKSEIPLSMFPVFKKAKDKETAIALGRKAIKEKLLVNEVKALVNAINEHPNKKEELLRKRFIGSHEAMDVQIHEIIKEPYKSRVVSEEEKAIDAQANTAKHFLDLANRVLSLIQEMKKIKYGPLCWRGIRRAMAGLVESFNEFTVEKEKEVFPQLEPINKVTIR